MSIPQPLICLVDDDESVRESLPDLLSQMGFNVQAFASAEAFLSSHVIERTRCLVVDVSMPGMSGPELHRELKARRQHIPVIFITAHQDKALAMLRLEEGAVACLLKPFSEGDLVAALHAALRLI